MKSLSILPLSFSLTLIGFAVACTTTVTRIVPAADASPPDSGKPSSSGGKVVGDDDDDDSTVVKKDGGKTSSGGEEDAAPPDCKKSTNQQECFTCCQDQFSAGATTYSNALRTCVCKDTVCKTDCKTTFCAATPKQPNNTCAACANSQETNDACSPELTDKCGADADCVKFNGCLTNSKCGEKPQ